MLLCPPLPDVGFDPLLEIEPDLGELLGARFGVELKVRELVGPGRGLAGKGGVAVVDERGVFGWEAAHSTSGHFGGKGSVALAAG